MRRRVMRTTGVLFVALGFIWACGFDDALREYLNARFWLPFAKGSRAFEKRGVKRISEPFAGMGVAEGDRSLAKLRAAYQEIAQPNSYAFDTSPQMQLVTAARADASLTPEEKEEVELIDAKIDMRAGSPEEPALLQSAKAKLEVFLKTARTPSLLSEARGWLAHVHYLLKDQTAAGKIYLDELNQNGSNLSRETLLDSLQMTYGYDGGPELLKHLEEYFDTPEHAAFAIQLATNPHWNRRAEQFPRQDASASVYARIHELMEKHSELLRLEQGANLLALLGMRVELYRGDPGAARKIGEAVPANAKIRKDPDFRWMLASVSFLSGAYKQAEQPLLALFRSLSPSDNRKSAAAYALCGVYRKTGEVSKQIRYALWLHTSARQRNLYLTYSSQIDDFTVYWAVSGWDLNLLLDAEAPVDALQAFVDKNPRLPDIRLVKYAIAVHLARADRYEQAAEIYKVIGAPKRERRMRQLVALWSEANRSGLSTLQQQEALYQVANYLQANPDRIYFNDSLWFGLQRYALERGSNDTRLNKAERELAILQQRKLQDEQEERWRAYLILHRIVNDAGRSEIGRRAARLALRCLRGINTDRFGREDDIRKADAELSSILAQ